MGHTRRKHNPQLKARTTRSSRGRLLSLSDSAQTSQLLDDQLRALGLYAAPTLGDGNCLFRALSDQLYGTDSRHLQLRQDICDWIQHHKPRYEPFVEDERGIDTHLQCMRENATYGGHMELSAFAHMAQRNVKVIQPGLVYVIEWQAFAAASSPTSESSSPPLPDKESHHQEEDPDDSTVYVAYHDWEHFSSIRNLKGPHVGLPRVKERSASQADSPPSPVAEEYKPAKERKKAERERERERKERKREKARDKVKYTTTSTTDKGKQKAEEEDLLTETEPEEEERDDSPEKLKIKLKLTLNSNPSSTNISESENTNARSSQPKTGLKLRLPPSRSLSVTPSTVSTPPTSQASTTSSASLASSSSTVPNASVASTSSSQYHSTTSVYPSIAQALPHAHPPTHTSAPHLISDSRDPSPGAPQRTNRSPKRTFDESELEDSHSTTGRVRSRLRGPERDDSIRSVNLHDVTMSGAGATERRNNGVGRAGGREATVERETEEREVAETLVQPPTSRIDEDSNGYESDNTTSSSSLSSPEPSSTKEEPEESGTPTTSPSNSPSIHQSDTPPPPPDPDTLSSPTTPIAPNQQQQQQLKIPSKKPQQQQQYSNLPVKSPITRRQKREAALAASGTIGAGENGRPMTRRQRKTLGLPKVRRMAGPYDRTRSGGGGNGKGGKDEEDGGEWKRNGTGRVDVRGFRELRI